MTKYNDTDGKTVLDASDDAATVNMGSGWRMPTNEEYAALGNAVNTEWTTNYQDSGVAGIICTDKTDSSKVLFFPACGNCYNGSVSFTGNHGVYLSSSLYDSDVQRAHDLSFGYGSIFDNSVKWQDYSMRYGGNTVRGVYVGPDPQRIPVSGVTADEKTSWNAKIDQTTFNSLVARVEALEQAQ